MIDFMILGSTNVELLKLKPHKENFFSSVRVTYMLRLWQVYQVAQVVTDKTGISFPKRLVYT